MPGERESSSFSYVPHFYRESVLFLHKCPKAPDSSQTVKPISTEQNASLSSQMLCFTLKALHSLFLQVFLAGTLERSCGDLGIFQMLIRIGMQGPGERGGWAPAFSQVPRWCQHCWSWTTLTVAGICMSIMFYFSQDRPSLPLVYYLGFYKLNLLFTYFKNISPLKVKQKPSTFLHLAREVSYSKLMANSNWFADHTLHTAPSPFMAVSYPRNSVRTPQIVMRKSWVTWPLFPL